MKKTRLLFGSMLMFATLTFISCTENIIILMLMKARSFGKLKKVKTNYIIKE